MAGLGDGAGRPHGVRARSTECVLHVPFPTGFATGASESVGGWLVEERGPWIVGRGPEGANPMPMVAGRRTPVWSPLGAPCFGLVLVDRIQRG